jgi:DNA-binding CsgD family transcriptional regulator
VQQTKQALALDHIDNQAASLSRLIELLGHAQLPVELARTLHDNLAVDHIHMLKVGHYERDFIQSASFDGSDAAKRLTRAFFDRKLHRFERELITGNSGPSNELTIVSDHTQSFASPEFRSFGREMGIGSRFLIRHSGPKWAIAIVLLWSIDCGNVSYLQPKVEAAAKLLTAVVGKHLIICDDREHLADRLSSIVRLEVDLRYALGEPRRREAQVGARIIAGQSASAIADALVISRETVISHRKRLYEHLGLVSGRELLLWYLSNHSYSPH